MGVVEIYVAPAVGYPSAALPTGVENLMALPIAVAIQPDADGESHPKCEGVWILVIVVHKDY
jgi:hypothetical protein